jgi:hypothetical protein
MSSRTHGPGISHSKDNDIGHANRESLPLFCHRSEAYLRRANHGNFLKLSLKAFAPS